MFTNFDIGTGMVLDILKLLNTLSVHIGIKKWLLLSVTINSRLWRTKLTLQNIFIYVSRTPWGLLTVFFSSLQNAHLKIR